MKMSTMKLSTGLAETNTTTPKRGLRRFLKPLLIALVVLLAIAGGVVVAYMPYVTNSNALQAALQHIESGAVPDEPAEYVQLMERESAIKPDLQLKPGTYSNLTTINEVTYNAVLSLQDGGKYEYALTVGTPRVYKLYKHSGRWWVDGRVIHTVLAEGDSILAAPAARDKRTPSRERIVDMGPDHITLQAHYGGPVRFTRVEQ